MKITEHLLKKIIREELSHVLNEQELHPHLAIMRQVHSTLSNMLNEMVAEAESGDRNTYHMQRSERADMLEDIRVLVEEIGEHFA